MFSSTFIVMLHYYYHDCYYDYNMNVTVFFYEDQIICIDIIMIYSFHYLAVTVSEKTTIFFLILFRKINY